MKIKIIIPIYNDWQSAFKLFEEIDNLKIDKNFEISIIVVNDASNHDRSNEEVIFDNIQSVKILNMKKNQGHARCIATGLKYILDKEERIIFHHFVFLWFHYDFMILLSGIILIFFLIFKTINLLII